MKNIIRIARNDIHNIRKNVIALIVIFGITIVPSLYAWFNIAASWDPYKNTGNLKVAVASLDKGYDGDCFRSGSISEMTLFLHCVKTHSFTGYLQMPRTLLTVYVPENIMLLLSFLKHSAKI